MAFRNQNRRVIFLLTPVLLLPGTAGPASGQAPASGETGQVADTLRSGREMTESLVEEGGVQPVPDSLRDAMANLPADAKKLVSDLDADKSPVTLNARTRACVSKLAALQASYAGTGNLEEAVAIRNTALAIRDAVAELAARLLEARPDPGNLTSLRDHVGQTYCFAVTGRQNGSLWGSAVYTDDSDIGTVAVHAGLLRAGQKGIVRVLMLPGATHYDSVEQNGIRSNAYETWQGSYRIEVVPF